MDDHEKQLPKLVHLQKPEPNPNVVKCLRDVLEEAESGKVQGIAIAYVGQHHGFSSAWRTMGRGVMTFEMLGAISSMLHSVNQDLIDDSVEVTE